MQSQHSSCSCAFVRSASYVSEAEIVSSKVKILCPYCLQREIDPAQAICAVCYAKEDELEQNHWNRLRERNNADEIQMYTLAQKVDEAFQVPEYEAYVCREKHDIGRAEAFEREMDAFHRRRILCMLEIFSHIDCSVLFPSHIELERYWNNVRDYANQRITAGQLGEISGGLRSQIMWKSLSSQQIDLGAELVSFWRGEEVLDWSYSQYFEITAGNLKPFIAMTLFTEILCRHFSDVMSEPVKRLNK